MPEPKNPTDAVPAHPLAEKVVWPLNLNEVKVVIEGLGEDGNVYRFRSAATLEIAKPEHLAHVEVAPMQDTRYVLAKPSQHFLTLVGQLVPDADGAVYVVEHLKEREL